MTTIRARLGAATGLQARDHPQGKLTGWSRGRSTTWRGHPRGSLTFGRCRDDISGDDFRQLWIPPGFAHGFCVLSEVAHVEYKCTEVYDSADDISILWNDPDLGIAWPIRDPIVSAKDSRAPRLREIAAGL